MQQGPLVREHSFGIQVFHVLWATGTTRHTNSTQQGHQAEQRLYRFSRYHAPPTWLGTFAAWKRVISSDCALLMSCPSGNGPHHEARSPSPQTAPEPSRGGRAAEVQSHAIPVRSKLEPAGSCPSRAVLRHNPMCCTSTVQALKSLTALIPSQYPHRETALRSWGQQRILHPSTHCGFLLQHRRCEVLLIEGQPLCNLDSFLGALAVTGPGRPSSVQQACKVPVLLGSQPRKQQQCTQAELLNFWRLRRVAAASSFESQM